MDVPYERQSDPTSNRMCGAAALCMVYRSFGATWPQAELWPSIARRNARGNDCAFTHLLAADALERGFSALVVQARDPWRIVELCAEHGLRAILNHRVDPRSPLGHYSVLVRLSGEDVFLHDPQLGPARRLSRSELLSLWRSEPAGSDIAGCVLVVLTNTPAQAITCSVCNTTSPLAIYCPSCHNPIPLHPGVVLGCVAASCTMRTWERVFCPQCDKEITDLTSGRSSAIEGSAVVSQTILIAQYSQKFKNAIGATYNELMHQYASEPIPDFRELVETMKRRIEGLHAKFQAEYRATTGAQAAANKPPAPAPTVTRPPARTTTGISASEPRQTLAPIGDGLLDQEEIQQVIERLLRDHRGSPQSAEHSRRFPA